MYCALAKVIGNSMSKQEDRKPTITYPPELLPVPDVDDEVEIVVIEGDAPASHYKLNRIVKNSNVTRS